MKKPGSQQLSLAASCLMCIILALRNTEGLEGTEFSGGWLTGPLLSMIGVGTVLFALAFIAAFFFPRIASAIGFFSSLLCLPLYLYLIAPVQFNLIFGSGHQFKVQPIPNFPSERIWASAGVLILMVTGYFCLLGFQRSRVTSNVPHLPPA